MTELYDGLKNLIKLRHCLPEELVQNWQPSLMKWVCGSVCVLDVVGKAVYEEEPGDLSQTAASLTGHH